MLAAQPDEQRAPRRRALAARAQGRARAGRRAGARRSSRRPSPRPTSSCSPGCGRCSASTSSIAVNVGAAPTPREVLEFFHAIGVPLAELWGMSETCGAGAVQPARPGQDRHRRAAVARASSSSSPTTASCSIRGDVVMPGYRNQPEKTAEAHRRRRLAAHRRHRRVRRRRLPQDRRPQEGADHQRGRQEHVAGQHRVDAQGRLAADRPGLRRSATGGPTTRR